MSVTLKQVREALNPDTASVKAGEFLIRRGFFYTGGHTSEQLAAYVKAAFPGAVILEHGETWKAFRGGAPVAQQSHWWVRFTVPESAAADLCWDRQAPTGGTSFCGYIPAGDFDAQAAALAAASGQTAQEVSADGKVTAEFTGYYKGQPFALYDYKGDRQFHIGGKAGLDVAGLQRAIGQLLGGV